MRPTGFLGTAHEGNFEELDAGGNALGSDQLVHPPDFLISDQALCGLQVESFVGEESDGGEILPG